jgi:predicted bacteriocin transport accessory protein
MRNTYIKAIKILFLSLIFITNLNGSMGKVTGGSSHELPKWFKESFLDLQEDIDEAKEKNKHVMLFLTLDFCPYCTKMLKDNFTTKNSTQEYIKKHFDVIGINIKGSKEIAINEDTTMTESEYAKYLKVKYTPTIIFLNEKNEIVVRLNGYRSAKNFKYILQYVNNKKYLTQSLEDYLEKVKNKTLYKLQNNALFQDISDLSKISTPLAVIFEDGGCTQCEYFHNVTLKNEDVKKELSKYTVVRFDATSTKDIITPQGKHTTPKQWVKDLKLDYRPGIILFNNKQQRKTIDALLYSFHLKELFRFVRKEYYDEYDSFLQYLGARQTELLNQGIDIDISDKQ